MTTLLHIDSSVRPSASVSRALTSAIVKQVGADKVIYAGYFPMGLSLDRIFTELRDVPFRAEVWPKFLRENAIRVLKLDA